MFGDQNAPDNERTGRGRDLLKLLRNVWATSTTEMRIGGDGAPDPHGVLGYRTLRRVLRQSQAAIPPQTATMNGVQSTTSKLAPMCVVAAVVIIPSPVYLQPECPLVEIPFWTAALETEAHPICVALKADAP